ncbi:MULTISPECIES: hypothetical protein [Streptomyces]|uniref:hypothetical protein n=1 Tax=Streptomyces TaxID=1883 RepID=UPI000F76A79E|nr:MULTISPECIES: hypothetical protein [Streptomyces]RSS32496.1 hypothetical protein EF902_46135 [Streptomyces sp. WAC05858]
MDILKNSGEKMRAKCGRRASPSWALELSGFADARIEYAFFFEMHHGEFIEREKAIILFSPFDRE